VAEVTGMSADAIQGLADANVVLGNVNGSGHLILTNRAGGIHDAGSVIGPTGGTGPTGATGPAGVAPTGSIVMWTTGVPPAGGWLVCNGAAVSRTTYAALFALIGTKFGVGDGATTFNLPNLSGKIARQDPAFATNLGVVGGADLHSHVITPHDHQLEGGRTDAVAHMTMISVVSPNIFMERLTGVATWTANISGEVTPVGSSTPNETTGAKVSGWTATSGTSPSNTASSWPPYLNLVFIIKN
jgi:microcystin-dependent protein